MTSVRVPLAHKSERAFAPPLRGHVDFVRHESEVLRNNPLGDPSSRLLTVYTPPSGRTEGLPLLVLLTGFSGSGWLHFPVAARYLSEPLVYQMERLIRAGSLGEAVIVAPDAITTLGGSQYLNSKATGRYEDYVTQEILPWAQERFHTARTGVLGHSSGGYGSLVLGMRHPDLFQGILASAPDGSFEFGYLSDIPSAVRILREKGGPEKFLEELLSTPPVVFSASHPYAPALNILAMASCYSPVESEPGAFELPFDWRTGKLDEGVWKRWLDWDPVRMIERPDCLRALAQMRTIVVGAGTSDEYALDLAGHQFVGRLKELGLRNVDESVLKGGHFDTWSVLMEERLPAFVRALQD